jgi:hypothetical protein
VTAAPAAAPGPDRFRVTYEELRGRVLAGALFGGAFGLVLLLREGLAAWMAGGSAGSVPVAPAVEPDRRPAAPLVSDEIHAAVVRVLASMALGGREERRA